MRPVATGVAALASEIRLDSTLMALPRWTRPGDVTFKLLCLACGNQERRTNCRQPYMSVEQVEQAVERYYAVVVMPEAMAETIRTGLRLELDQQHARAQPEIDYATRRVTELEAERRRLARGVVNGSIPEDLAAEEQDRIATELRQAKAVASVAEDIYARIEDTLTIALSYVTRVEEVYRIGKPHVRRLANQCFFESS